MVFMSYGNPMDSMGNINPNAMNANSTPYVKAPVARKC